MRGSTNKFWECWSRQPMWNETGKGKAYLPSPQKTGHLNLTVMSKSCFSIYYYYFLKIWLLVLVLVIKYSSHWDTTRASRFDYWSKKAKPEVSQILQYSQVPTPNSPNPYFNLKFCFFFFPLNLFDLFLVNIFFIL